MGDRLGFGVVGINQRVRRSVLNGIVQSRRGRLAAICSRDPEKAARTAGELDCTAYTSFGDMLADKAVDVVFVCTPHAFHHPMTLEALAAGKWVVCEKPLALSAVDAEAMVGAAARAGVPNAVNFTYHSLPGHRFVERLLRDGEIGRLRHLSLTYWQARQALDGAKLADALLDIGSHLIDLACWWGDAGQAGEIQNIVGQEGGRVELPPLWMALARTDRDVLISFQANRVAAGWRNGMNCSLVGDRGTIDLTFDTDTAEVRIAKLGDGSPEGELRRLPIPSDLWVSYQQFPAHHVDQICASLVGEEYFPDFEHGLRVQRILDASRAAVGTGGWVAVDHSATTSRPGN